MSAFFLDSSMKVHNIIALINNSGVKKPAHILTILGSAD